MTISRTYTKVTADMEAAVLAARETLGPTATYAEVAAIIDVPERTVRYIVTDMPRLRRVAGGEGVAESLKARILHAVKEIGPFPDVVALRGALGMADDEHHIVHCLHSLHKAGAVDFDERRREHPTDIRLQARVRKASHTTTDGLASAGTAGLESLEAIRPQADTTPTTVALEVPSETTPDNPPTTPEASVSGPDDMWPELSALATRERERIEAERRATVYQEAALSIEKLGDYPEAERLMNRAAEVAPDATTALEREILAFVNAVIRDHGTIPQP